MKPGEYIGKDGRTYRWQLGQPCTGIFSYFHYFVDDENCCHMAQSFRAADWPAAKAALDALIEAEAGEWVQIAEHGYNCQDYALRIRPDGSDPQGATSPRAWRPEAYTVDWVVAYRKGREVALAEQAEAQATFYVDGRKKGYEEAFAQVQELVEAIGRLEPAAKGAALLNSEFNAIEAAKKVKL